MPTSPLSARLSGRTRVALVTTMTVLLSLALMVGPVLATEGEHEKIPLPESQHDLVGLAILGITALAALAGLANAVKQLRGDRDQATGEYRWR